MTPGLGSAYRPQPEAEGVGDLRALGRLLMGAPPGPGLDWEAVLALARGYDLSPLLDFRLCEAGSIGACVQQKSNSQEDLTEFLPEAIARAKPPGLRHVRLRGDGLCAA